MIETQSTHETVVLLLGREPKAPYAIRVTNGQGEPIVIENSPICFDGEPMPTRYWLVGNHEVKAIGHVESSGGVQRAEDELPAEEIAILHEGYAIERDMELSPDHQGATPTGGVGGTRTGVKCLHAHYAHWLVTRNDIVGEWTHFQLQENGEARDEYAMVAETDRVWWNGAN